MTTVVICAIWFAFCAAYVFMSWSAHSRRAGLQMAVVCAAF